MKFLNDLFEVNLRERWKFLEDFEREIRILLDIVWFYDKVNNIK